VGRVSTDATRRRRRGPELESALLAAAWAELVEVGYARFTMASTAARAGTSEAVLYRRWPDKHQLALAAIEERRSAYELADPDTGSLRTDLIAQLTDVSRTLAGFYAIASAAAFSGLAADTGLTFAQVRERLMGDRPRVRPLYRRAHERGELDLDRVPDAVLALPFDLVRHDMLLDLKPLRRARIVSIVDELFLPLVARQEDHP
jgi:AcrR family transcriptional regulator